MAEKVRAAEAATTCVRLRDADGAVALRECGYWCDIVGVHDSSTRMSMFCLLTQGFSLLRMGFSSTMASLR